MKIFILSVLLFIRALAIPAIPSRDSNEPTASRRSFGKGGFKAGEEEFVVGEEFAPTNTTGKDWSEAFYEGELKMANMAE